MLPTVNLMELELALDTVSDMYSLNDAWICRTTGRVIILFDESIVGESEEEIPEDIGDSSRYLEVPRKQSLDLGARLVFDFIEDRHPELYDQVSDFFRRGGAYRRFKDLLEERGVIEEWYDYELGETRRRLEEWCREEGFDVDRGPAGGA